MKRGIDVSYCQGNIDFSKIDKNQVQFAIIRSSFGWEQNQKDNYFERNYSGFKKLGIPVGAYHYSYAKTKEQAIKEAEYCLECIEGKSFELPVFIDMEEQNCAAAGRRACTDVAKAFIQTIEKAGYSSGVYTNPNWLENYLYKDEIIGKVNLWLAQWGSSKPYCDCMLWQYNVGKSGSVKGISGNIDLDYCLTEIKSSTPKTSTSASVKKNSKTVEELANEVIAGKWGSGDDRKSRLKNAGYDYTAVQNKVNEKLLGSKKHLKSTDEIAREVIAGKWGAGDERKKKLTSAGYNYVTVQTRVNEIMSGRKSVDAIAREVIQGKWGNGDERRKKLTEAGYNYSEVQSKVNQLMR